MILVDGVKTDYSRQVQDVEEGRIFRTHEKSEGSLNIEGHTFDFTFNRPIEDWGKFLPRMFDAKWPFRIWGVKTKIDNGFYRILGVDMHTGHPLDIEITNGLIRCAAKRRAVEMSSFGYLQIYRGIFDSTLQSPQIN